MIILEWLVYIHVQNSSERWTDHTSICQRLFLFSRERELNLSPLEIRCENVINQSAHGLLIGPVRFHTRGFKFESSIYHVSIVGQCCDRKRKFCFTLVYCLEWENCSISRNRDKESECPFLVHSNNSHLFGSSLVPCHSVSWCI